MKMKILVASIILSTIGASAAQAYGDDGWRHGGFNNRYSSGSQFNGYGSNYGGSNYGWGRHRHRRHHHWW